MRLPALSEQAIARSIPGVTDVCPPLRGGQKLVFPCTITGRRYALKVMLTGDRRKGAAALDDLPTEVETRARREVEILRRCQSAHLTTLGPVGMGAADIAGQRVVYFTEDWVEGKDLRSILRDSGPLSFVEVVRLGIDIARAIDTLWSMGVVHRDIKPGNIMRRCASGEFVLLDLGSALDLNDRASQTTGRLPGTRMYFSPERLTATSDRSLDHRSDLFSLGIVLYEATTGIHPFAFPAADDGEILGRIQMFNPLRPSSYRTRVPMCLGPIVMRLLAKKPSRRYSTCLQVIDALAMCERSI